MPLEKLLTVDEAADVLNTTPRFVRRLITERRICFHHIGRHGRIAERDLKESVDAGRVTAPTVEWQSGKAVR